MDHVEKCAAAHQTEIACQRIASARGNQRNPLVRAVDTFEDFEKRSIAANRNDATKPLRFLREFGRMSRPFRQHCHNVLLSQARQQRCEPGRVPVPARARIHDGQPEVSQGVVPFVRSTRSSPPTSLRHSGSSQMSAISSERETT